MRATQPNVSLETLIAASPLLGHELEDRGCISHAQDPRLAERLLDGTSCALRSHSQRDLFLVAPLDILVAEQNGHKQFHLLELNGTGIGGITNLPDEPLAALLRSLAETAERMDNPDSLVLLAVSGKESTSAPRMNRLMHEKLLFVEAIRQGLERRHHCSQARNLSQLAAESGHCRLAQPTVVLGYMKDLIAGLELDSDGTLWLHGRQVTAAVNDRFCSNVLQHFHNRVDLRRWQTVNRTFAAGSDKGVAYQLMNEYVQRNPDRSLPDAVHYEHAECRAALIETVLAWLAAGRQVVIKPHGTGLGHGIEFFFSRHEPVDDIVARIDRSLLQTEEFYGLRGGALPYTVCEYVDACQVTDGYARAGHKFELRVVVYRDGAKLKAFPSIAKVARERHDPARRDRRSLINNITASGDTAKVCGTDYTLPLCNERTLHMLGLSADDLYNVCRMATGYVRHVVDQVEDHPARFGLPGADRRAILPPRRVAVAA